jgi:protein-S-isoprenylcysteine O-methyltransferase Ste14
MTSNLFILTLIFAFLTIFGESVSLILQLRGRKMTQWLGARAFTAHMMVTGTLWIASFALFLLLQREDHPLFHESTALRYSGIVLFLGGGAIALWAFLILGLKRSLCLNFFEENVPVVRRGPYQYLANPLDYGLWIALIGIALMTGSWYNLIISLEVILIMIPHMLLENMRIQEKKQTLINERRE